MARWLIWLGFAFTVVGFAMFASGVLGFISSIAESAQNGTGARRRVAVRRGGRRFPVRARRVGARRRRLFHDRSRHCAARAAMTFNIGSQSGGVFNNVAGDQTVYGGQQAYAGAEQELRELRTALARYPLPAGPAAVATAELNEIEGALRAGPEPDRGRAARALERLTRLLSGAGSLAVAGVALVQPLRGLATWLGPVAERVITMLPR
jgi:hypothetical protein